jgi:hypothetical protein
LGIDRGRGGLIRQEETDSGPASAAPSLGQVDILEGSLARSPENLVGIGETGEGCKIQKMTETGLLNSGF